MRIGGLPREGRGRVCGWLGGISVAWTPKRRGSRAGASLEQLPLPPSVRRPPPAPQPIPPLAGPDVAPMHDLQRGPQGSRRTLASDKPLLTPALYSNDPLNRKPIHFPSISAVAAAVEAGRSAPANIL